MVRDPAPNDASGPRPSGTNTAETLYWMWKAAKEGKPGRIVVTAFGHKLNPRLDAVLKDKKQVCNLC